MRHVPCGQDGTGIRPLRWPRCRPLGCSRTPHVSVLGRAAFVDADCRFPENLILAAASGFRNATSIAIKGRARRPALFFSVSACLLLRKAEPAAVPMLRCVQSWKHPASFPPPITDPPQPRKRGEAERFLKPWNSAAKGGWWRGLFFPIPASFYDGRPPRPWRRCFCNNSEYRKPNYTPKSGQKK